MELPINQIIEDDCLNVISTFPDESIDLILTDTPYGINYQSNMGKIKQFDKIHNDDNLDFFVPFIRHAHRILKPNSCMFLFCRFDNYPYFYNTVKDMGFNIKNCLVWEKSKGNGGLGDMEASFINNYEFVLFVMKGRRILFNKGQNRQHGLITDKTITNPQQIVYPTQKPTEILKKLIKITTNPKDVVLDCFCGSGSTCTAAKQVNRNYIGIDINPTAIKITKERLGQGILFTSE